MPSQESRFFSDGVFKHQEMVSEQPASATRARSTSSDHSAGGGVSLKGLVSLPNSPDVELTSPLLQFDQQSQRLNHAGHVHSDTDLDDDDEPLPADLSLFTIAQAMAGSTASSGERSHAHVAGNLHQGVSTSPAAPSMEEAYQFYATASFQSHANTSPSTPHPFWSDARSEQSFATQPPTTSDRLDDLETRMEGLAPGLQTLQHRAETLQHHAETLQHHAELLDDNYNKLKLCGGVLEHHALMLHHHGESVSTYHNAVRSHAETIYTLQKCDADHDLRVAALENNEAKHLFRISALERGEAHNDHRVSAMEYDEARNKTRVSVLENDEAKYNFRVSALESGEAYNDHRVSALERGEADRDLRVSALEARVNAMMIGKMTPVTPKSTLSPLPQVTPTRGASLDNQSVFQAATQASTNSQTSTVYEYYDDRGEAAFTHLAAIHPPTQAAAGVQVAVAQSLPIRGPPFAHRFTVAPPPQFSVSNEAQQLMESTAPNSPSGITDRGIVARPHSADDVFASVSSTFPARMAAVGEQVENFVRGLCFMAMSTVSNQPGHRHIMVLARQHLDHKHMACVMLDSASLRPFLITGIINRLLANQTYEHGVLHFFPSQYSEQYGTAWNKETAAAAPLGPSGGANNYDHRLALANERVRIATLIAKSKGFWSWVAASAKQISDKIVHDVAPLLPPGRVQEGFNALTPACHEALVIAVQMRLQPKFYQVAFYNCSSRWEHTRMIQRTPELLGQACDQEPPIYVVRCCMVPFVREKTFATKEWVTLQKAEVILCDRKENLR